MTSTGLGVDRQLHADKTRQADRRSSYSHKTNIAMPNCCCNLHGDAFQPVDNISRAFFYFFSLQHAHVVELQPFEVPVHEPSLACLHPVCLDPSFPCSNTTQDATLPQSSKYYPPTPRIATHTLSLYHKRFLAGAAYAGYVWGLWRSAESPEEE